MPTIPERIQAFNAGRLPIYTALKYRNMAENPFRFLRGSAHLFYEDLSPTFLPVSPLSWISGDLHLENFGTYKGDNRLVYFDLNDFDEGALAPAAWELARMVTSIYTGFESLGIDKKEARRTAALFLQTYSFRLGLGRARYLEKQTARGIVQLLLDQVAERKQKELIRQRTLLKNDALRLRIDESRFFTLDKVLRKELKVHFTNWVNEEPTLKSGYRVLDSAFRIAGTGSLGVRRYVFLLQHKEDLKKYLLIDMKEALPSCTRVRVSNQQPSWASEAERIIAIQERMQNIPPALLSTTNFQGVPYVVKEMQPTADKIDFLLIRERYKDLACVIEDMALLTASAQLRSAGRQGSAIADALIAFGKEEGWQQGILDYAEAYAGKVREDYAEYFKAYKAGTFG